MTARAWGRLVVVIVGTLVAQVSVLDQVVVLNAHPDAMVLIPVGAGLLGGAERGALFGFIAGLAADLVVPLPFGMSALVFVLLGFGAGLARTLPGWSELGASAVPIAAFGAGAGTLGYGVLAAILSLRGALGLELLDALVVVVVASLLLAPAVLGAMRWVLAGTAPAFLGGGVPTGGSARA